MIVKNKTMMDAGCILFTRKQEGTGLGIGTELGQLLAHLKEFGKVERIDDLDASPSAFTPPPTAGQTRESLALRSYTQLRLL